MFLGLNNWAHKCIVILYSSEQNYFTRLRLCCSFVRFSPNLFWIYVCPPCFSDVRSFISLANMLSCCRFGSGKFPSSLTEYLSSLPLLSSGLLGPSCSPFFILSLRMLHTASFSNPFFYQKGYKHLWLSRAFFL